MSTGSEDCLQLLDDREAVEDESRSLASCLRAFTMTEILSAPNTYECEKCCVPYNKQVSKILFGLSPVFKSYFEIRIPC